MRQPVLAHASAQGLQEQFAVGVVGENRLTVAAAGQAW